MLTTYVNFTCTRTHILFLFFWRTLIQCSLVMRMGKGLDKVRAKFPTPGSQKKGVRAKPEAGLASKLPILEVKESVRRQR